MNSPSNSPIVCIPLKSQRPASPKAHMHSAAAVGVDNFYVPIFRINRRNPRLRRASTHTLGGCLNTPSTDRRPTNQPTGGSSLQHRVLIGHAACTHQREYVYVCAYATGRSVMTAELHNQHPNANKICRWCERLLPNRVRRACEIAPAVSLLCG
jgi:hypothetical protein